MVVQSNHPPHARKYPNLLSGAYTLLVREEGWSAFYASPRLTPVIALHAMVVSAFRCFRTTLATTAVRGMVRVLLASPAPSPAVVGGLFMLADLALLLGELVVVLPLETIKRRMYCQLSLPRRGRRTTKPFRTLVPLHPLPYTGLADALHRILWVDGMPAGSPWSPAVAGTPSRADMVLVARQRRRTFWRGVVCLYRGFKARLLTSTVLLLLRWALTVEVE
jgi:fusion and transport protein UGO1